MGNVVYLLGAGFSAPLGLPLIRNFLEKSKDQYENAPDKFEHFGKVFETIKRISYATGTYKTDLNNIEEILSILEMEGMADQIEHSKLFTEYISDVISHYTPPFSERDAMREWQGHVLPKFPWDGYVMLMLLSSGYMLKKKNPERSAVSDYEFEKTNTVHNYSFITLNYDLVLEKAIEYIFNRHNVQISLLRPGDTDSSFKKSLVSLAKLHGSVDTKIIIPPTWGKSAFRQMIYKEWTLAHELLSKAHHIRIVGYSLPEMDSYVRYLLRSAAVNSFYLKQIDVICADPDGRIKQRYNEFICFPNYKFSSNRVESFFHALIHSEGNGFPHQIKPDLIERAHMAAMNV